VMIVHRYVATVVKVTGFEADEDTHLRKEKKRDDVVDVTEKIHLLEKAFMENVKSYPPNIHELLAEFNVNLGKTPRAVNLETFPFHSYITVALHESSQIISLPAAGTYLKLAALNLFCILLTYHYKIALMYFLPAIIVLLLCVYTIMYFIGTHLLRKTLNHPGFPSHEAHAAHDEHAGLPIKPARISNIIQAIHYALCYSFTRLLLSADIWTYHRSIANMALVGMIITLILVWFLGSWILIQTLVALSIPPNISAHHLGVYLSRMKEQSN
jgi:hypothetical protein